MTVQQLIDRLKQFNPTKEIMILDGNNGEGDPRELNLLRLQTITKENKHNTADCDDLVIGQRIVTIGFGCSKRKEVSQ